MLDVPFIMVNHRCVYCTAEYNCDCTKDDECATMEQEPYGFCCNEHMEAAYNESISRAVEEGYKTADRLANMIIGMIMLDIVRADFMGRVKFYQKQRRKVRQPSKSNKIAHHEEKLQRQRGEKTFNDLVKWP